MNYINKYQLHVGPKTYNNL